MVVEDEPDIYDVLLAMFEIWGIDGVAFVDGAEAVAWIDDVEQGRVGGELPELAILDIRLPEVTGPEVGARLRRSKLLSNLGIVLITAFHMSPEQEKQAIALAQADLLLTKPLPALADLRAQFAEIIARRRAAAPPLAPAAADTQPVAPAPVAVEAPPIVEPAPAAPPPIPPPATIEPPAPAHAEPGDVPRDGTASNN
jgi:CheY-like chemotaxis protein